MPLPWRIIYLALKNFSKQGRNCLQLLKKMTAAVQTKLNVCAIQSFAPKNQNAPNALQSSKKNLPPNQKAAKVAARPIGVFVKIVLVLISTKKGTFRIQILMIVVPNGYATHVCCMTEP